MRVIRRSTSGPVVAVVLAIGVFVAGACSSGSSGSTGSSATPGSNGPAATATDVPGSVPSFLSESLDHDGFVARLQQICTTPALGGDIGGQVDDTSSSDDVDAVVDAVETRLELMHEMPVPDADQQAWSAVEQAYDRYLTTMTDLSDARVAEDDARSQQFAAQLDDLRNQVQSAVDALGIGDCKV